MPDADRFRPPVDILDPQIADLAGSQAIGREQLQDGVVPQTRISNVLGSKKVRQGALIPLTVLSKDQLSKLTGTAKKYVICEAYPAIDAEPCRMIFCFISLTYQ